MHSPLKIIAASWVVSLAFLTSVAYADVSLVHRYSFNDGSAKDSVGRAHGKLVGGASISDGKAHFTGAPADRIELLAKGTDGININTLKAVTLEVWYMADKAQDWQRLFDFGASGGLDAADATGANSVSYVVTSGYMQGPSDCAKGHSACAILSNADPSYTSEAVAMVDSAPLGQKVHTAVVVDSSRITLYINGVQAAQTPLDGRTLAKVSNDYALLGHSLYGGGTSLAGSIDEFRIYSGAATAEQVAASFKAGADRPVIGLKN
jgi:hypothetical protein